MDPRFKPYSNMNAALAFMGPDDNFSDMLTWVPQSMRPTQVHPMLIPSPAPVFQDNSLPPVGTTVRPVDVLAWNSSAHCPDPVPGLTVSGLSEVMPPPDHDLSMHPNALVGQADDHQGCQSTTAMPNTFDLLPDQHLQPIFSCSGLGQSECLDDQPHRGRVHFEQQQESGAVVSGPPAQSMDIAGSVQLTLQETSLGSAKTTHTDSPNDAFSCPEPGCGKSFDRDYLLHIHTQLPHIPGHSLVNLPECKNSCECGARFTRLSSFKRHVNLNRKAVKTYPCPRKDLGCPYTGKREEHVKQHLKHAHKLSPSELEAIMPRVYTGVIDNCDVNGCDAGPFTSQSEFTKHKREEHELTPYPCFAAGCDRNGSNGFVSHEAYRKHVEKQHSSLGKVPPRPTKIEMCGACRITMASSSLHNHLKYRSCKGPRDEQYTFAMKRFPPSEASRQRYQRNFSRNPWWYDYNESAGNEHR